MANNSGEIYNPKTKRWIKDTAANRRRLGKPLKSTTRKTKSKSSKTKTSKPKSPVRSSEPTVGIIREQYIKASIKTHADYKRNATRKYMSDPDTIGFVAYGAFKGMVDPWPSDDKLERIRQLEELAEVNKSKSDVYAVYKYIAEL